MLWKEITIGFFLAGFIGLLGNDFFHQVDVEFDLAHGAVRLFQPRDCDGVSLAYWATDRIGEVEIDTVAEAHPQIVLTIRINGQPIKALLDSGASTSVLNKSDAARLGVTPDTTGVVGIVAVRAIAPLYGDTVQGAQLALCSTRGGHARRRCVRVGRGCGSFRARRRRSDRASRASP